MIVGVGVGCRMGTGVSSGHDWTKPGDETLVLGEVVVVVAEKNSRVGKRDCKKSYKIKTIGKNLLTFQKGVKC